MGGWQAGNGWLEEAKEATKSSQGTRAPYRSRLRWKRVGWEGDRASSARRDERHSTRVESPPPPGGATGDGFATHRNVSLPHSARSACPCPPRSRISLSLHHQSTTCASPLAGSRGSRWNSFSVSACGCSRATVWANGLYLQRASPFHLARPLLLLLLLLLFVRPSVHTCN